MVLRDAEDAGQRLRTAPTAFADRVRSACRHATRKSGRAPARSWPALRVVFTTSFARLTESPASGSETTRAASAAGLLSQLLVMRRISTATGSSPGAPVSSVDDDDGFTPRRRLAD